MNRLQHFDGQGAWFFSEPVKRVEHLLHGDQSGNTIEIHLRRWQDLAP